MTKVHNQNTTFSSKIFKKTLPYWPLLGLIALAIFRALNKNAYFNFIGEDGPIEYAQFFFYLLACIMTFLISKKLLSQKKLWPGLLYLVLFLGLFFMAGEEVSWGQRIFGWDNPEFFQENNVQEETTFHNLEITKELLTPGYILIGLSLGLILPIIKKILTKKGQANGTFCRYFLPDFKTSAYFLPVGLFYLYFYYLRQPLIDFLANMKIPAGSFWGRETLIWIKVNHYTIADLTVPLDQEVVEFFLAAGVLLFMVNVWRQRFSTDS